MKKIQQFYLYSYRSVGFIFLTGLITSIICYGYSIIFFMVNTTWSVPMILSPNQEKVITHLEHLINFEAKINQNKRELLATKQAFIYKQQLLDLTQLLLTRVEHSMTYQAKLYRHAAKIFQQLGKEKTIQLNQLSKLNDTLEEDEQLIDQELEAGMITKREALIAQLSANKFRSGLLDAKISQYDLKTKAGDYIHAAHTLNGSGESLRLMSKVLKKAELDMQIAQLKSDLLIIQQQQSNLQQDINHQSKIIRAMKKNPYILATKKTTTVAFVPYSHLQKVVVGGPVFSCYLDMVFCYHSGTVLGIYHAEEYNKHPVFKSDIKGQFIGVQFFSQTDAQKKLLFLNSKPLLV